MQSNEDLGLFYSELQIWDHQCLVTWTCPIGSSMGHPLGHPWDLLTALKTPVVTSQLGQAWIAELEHHS